MRKLILPFLALLIFIAESVCANVFSQSLYAGGHLYIPRIIVIFIAFLAIYGPRRQAMIYGAVLGFMYDVAYTEVLGVYLFAFTGSAYLISKLMKILQSNLLIGSIVTLIFIGLIDAAVFQLNLLLGFTSMAYEDYAMTRLVPTLILNLVFLIILCYPFKRMIESLRADIEGE